MSLEGFEQSQETSGTEIQETESQGQSEITEPQEGLEAQAQELLDLDKLEKFRFQGKEYTLKQLQQERMFQSDYSKKTQEIAKERKYYDNLEFDLAKVKSNPSLIAEFKKVYPEKFHKLLDVLGVQAQVAKPGSGAPDTELLSRLEKIEKTFAEREADAFNAQLDAKFETLSKKFPMADEDLVTARAQMLHEKGEKLTDQVWETLWKQAHDGALERYKKHQSELVKSQKQINQKAKDVSSGGGTPGPSSPKKNRTIKEATEAFLREGMSHG